MQAVELKAQKVTFFLIGERPSCKRQVTSSTVTQAGHSRARLAIPAAAPRDKRAHCNWLEQLRIADYALVCGGDYGVAD